MAVEKRKIELLAPAGSPESLEAAVANGADAVYLGLDEFSARAKAVNFNKDNLRHYVSFCHNRNVRVYVTLNTLLYDNEMQRAFEAACLARNCGADALILQDMGLFHLVKKYIPDIPLHASTQVSINSAAGAAMMKELGFDRVILAREMSLKGITEATATGIETEVFVHGARCYSYSGQCLMSSMLGGRSGNRGLCAQTCRLPYTLYDERDRILLSGHLLSLRDTLYLSELNTLRDAGVSALKIEGRMKGPEYVAAVTSVYRKYLVMESDAGIDKQDLDDLLKAFNREGFSKGALSERPGFNEFAANKPSDSGFPVGKVTKAAGSGSMVSFNEDIKGNDGLRIGNEGGYAEREVKSGMSSFISIPGKPGDVVYRTKDNAFNSKYSYSESMKKLPVIPIRARAVIKTGQCPFMEVYDEDGNIGVGSLDSPVERARMNGTPRQRIEEQLRKTGSTDYEITEFDLQCDDGVYIRISDINEIRRKSLETLYTSRAAIPEEIPCPEVQMDSFRPVNDLHEYSLLLYNVPNDFDPSVLDVRRIYLDYENCRKDISRVRSLCLENNIEFFLHLPYSTVTTPNEDCDGYLVENHGMLKSIPFERAVIGSGFNSANSFSIMGYKGALGVTLSHEISIADIKELSISPDIPLEATIYGNIKVMESPYCPARDICSGALCIERKLRLTDRKNESWGIIFNPKRHSVRIFNPHKLMVFDKLDELSRAGIRMFRLNITDETNDDIEKLLESARHGTMPSGSSSGRYTNGRF